jgi:hypothetical protein
MKKTNLPVIYKDPNKRKEGEVVPSEDMNSEEANTTYLDAVDSLRYAVEAMRFPPRVNTFKQFAFDPNNIGQCIVTEDADFEVIENNSKSFENGKNKGLPYIPAEDVANTEKLIEVYIERMKEGFAEMLQGARPDFKDPAEDVILTPKGWMTVIEWEKFLQDKGHNFSAEDLEKLVNRDFKESDLW